MIGSKLDMKRRASKNFQRTYSLEVRTRLGIARNLIYAKRSPIQGVHVRRLLDDYSLAPSIVSLYQRVDSSGDLLCSRMHSESAFTGLVLTHIQCSS